MNEQKQRGPRGTVTVTEAARIMDVCEDTVRRYIRDGAIPAKRAGRRMLIPKAWLDNWFDNLPDAKSSGAK